MAVNNAELEAAKQDLQEKLRNYKRQFYWGNGRRAVQDADRIFQSLLPFITAAAESSTEELRVKAIRTLAEETRSLRLMPCNDTYWVGRALGRISNALGYFFMESWFD